MPVPSVYPGSSRCSRGAQAGPVRRRGAELRGQGLGRRGRAVGLMYPDAYEVACPTRASRSSTRS